MSYKTTIIGRWLENDCGIQTWFRYLCWTISITDFVKLGITGKELAYKKCYIHLSRQRQEAHNGWWPDKVSLKIYFLCTTVWFVSTRNHQPDILYKMTDSISSLLKEKSTHTMGIEPLYPGWQTSSATTMVH